MAAIGVVDGIAGAPCRGSQAVPDKEHLDGLRSGEYLGRKKSFEPTAWMAARTTFGAVRSQIEGSVQNLSHFWAAVDPVDTNSQWVRLTRGIPEARADMILTVANEGRFAMAAPVGLRGDYDVAALRRLARSADDLARSGGCWHWPQSMPGVLGAKQRRSVGWGCRRCGTGWCDSTPRGRPGWQRARRRETSRFSESGSAWRCARSSRKAQRRRSTGWCAGVPQALGAAAPICQGRGRRSGL